MLSVRNSGFCFVLLDVGVGVWVCLYFTFLKLCTDYLFPLKNVWEFPGSLVVKDLALSLLWFGLLLWHGFDPWPRNFHMPWERPKKKKKKSVLYM